VEPIERGGTLISAQFSTDGEFFEGSVTRLIEHSDLVRATGGHASYNVSPDGQSFPFAETARE